MFQMRYHFDLHHLHKSVLSPVKLINVSLLNIALSMQH